MAEIAQLVEPGWTTVEDHGSGIRSLHYPDGAVRIEHQCRVVDGYQLITAPALQLSGGHSIAQREPLTVTPSILCGDCGLHGFIRDGKWVGA